MNVEWEVEISKDLSLEICQSLSEEMRTTFLSYLPESDWENILNIPFVSYYKPSAKVSNGKQIVVRAFRKPSYNNAGFLEEQINNLGINNCDKPIQKKLRIAPELNINDKLLVIPLPIHSEISKSGDGFYQNWRSRCICKIKSSIASKILSQDHDNRKIQKSKVASLNFPQIRETPPISLPQTLCQDILRTKSYTPISNVLSEMLGSIHNNNNQEWIVHHPGIVQIQKVIKGKKLDYLIQNFEPYTLESLLQFSRKMFKGDIQKLFVIYQLIRVLKFSHDQGLIHGNITPCNILVSKTLWVSLTGFNLPKSVPYLTLDEVTHLHPDQHNGSLFSLWYKGEVSNFDYIMALNAMAKRRAGTFLNLFFFDFGLGNYI